ncbi:MAG: RodZ domain-containing protein [Pseudomonadota bacterium]
MTERGDAPSHTHDHTPMGFDDYELILGDILRGERATLGKSLLDVQRDIKVKASYIAAIEDGDLSAFETPGFIAGYVRSYGRYLGLDPDLVYRAFCEQTGFSHFEGLDARAYATERTGPNRRARPQPVATGGDAVLSRNPIYRAPKENPFSDIRPAAIASVLALVTLMGGLGYGGWSVFQSIQRVTLVAADAPVAFDITPEISTNALVGTDPATGPSSEALMALYRPEALDAPVMVPRDGPISTLNPEDQGAFAGLSQQLSEQFLASADTLPETGALASLLPAVQGPMPLPAAQVEGVTVLAPPPPDVVLFSRQEVWVRVSAADGTVLLEGLMQEGDRFVLPQMDTPPTLRSGNSGDLFFAVNGETLGPAGEPGAVTKNVELSVAALSERFQPANLSEDPDLRRLASLAITPDETEAP